MAFNLKLSGQPRKLSVLCQTLPVHHLLLLAEIHLAKIVVVRVLVEGGAGGSMVIGSTVGESDVGERTIGGGSCADRVF